MLHDWFLSFQSFPPEGKFFSVALLLFLALGTFGLAYVYWPRKPVAEGDEVEMKSRGWRKYVLEPFLIVASVCGLVLECIAVPGFALTMVFAPVWLLTGFFECPYGVAAIVGMPIGLFLAAKVLLATGIAER